MNVKFLKYLCLMVISFILFHCTSLKKTPRSSSYDTNEPNESNAEATKKEWDLDFDKPWAGKAEPKVTDNSEASPFTKKFEKDSELDVILSPQPIQVALQEKPKESSGSAISVAPEPEKNKSSSESYRIQLLTVAEFETAQAKKRAFSQQIGAGVDIFFDAPFYKLRFGYFKSKSQAEEKLLDLMDIGLQGFVIKE